MKTSEIIKLDYRKEENREIIQKVLRQIKPLSKCSEENDVPLEKVEKAVYVICRKYNVDVSAVYCDYMASDLGFIHKLIIWDSKTLQAISHIYGYSLYETFAKTCVCLYGMIKQNKLGLRT